MRILLSTIVAFSLCACGGEDEHDHDASEFATRQECEEHYAAEGHTDTEIEELCQDLG